MKANSLVDDNVLYGISYGLMVELGRCLLGSLKHQTIIKTWVVNALIHGVPCKTNQRLFSKKSSHCLIRHVFVGFCEALKPRDLCLKAPGRSEIWQTCGQHRVTEPECSCFTFYKCTFRMQICWGPFHVFTLISAWISNHMPGVWGVGWIYLSIPKLQLCNRWSLGMGK